MKRMSRDTKFVLGGTALLAALVGAIVFYERTSAASPPTNPTVPPATNPPPFHIGTTPPPPSNVVIGYPNVSDATVTVAAGGTITVDMTFMPNGHAGAGLLPYATNGVLTAGASGGIYTFKALGSGTAYLYDAAHFAVAKIAVVVP